MMLDVPLRRQVAEVFADLAAENGAAGKILQTAQAWARREEADLAYVALARTCLHPVVGGRVRTGLYEWSRERRAAQTLKLTIVRVGQVLGETYPSIAMTRLKHLATFGNAQVRDEVAEAAGGLARVHRREVFEAALEWCEAAVRCSSERDGAGLAGVALRVLVDLVRGGPDGAGPLRLRAVLDAVGNLAAEGGRFGPLAMGAAETLAAEYPAEVVRAALGWVNDVHDDPFGRTPERARFGSALFVALASGRDEHGHAVMLTGQGAVDPEDCAFAWQVALGEPLAGDRGVVDVAELWLDTALARPDLRPGIVECLVWAAYGDRRRRRRAVDLVRAWSETRRDGRDVRDDVLVELLLPEWRRLLLRLQVGLRRAAGG
ncbi:hypothetical protein [Actinomadura welshii]|uniref:hypothetical protein n=1 Tax=Actinomadura welshii TaxID=3103817 RepID=UPI0012687F6C|nr:hypothetical protein [Actinomadura madurae]